MSKPKDKIDLYYLDMNLFNKIINKLKKNQLKNVTVKNNTVSGDITVLKDKTLFMAIPYDKGWNVYVDGKKVKYEKVAGDFIGIKLNKGNHKIKMKYYSEGIVPGVLMSFVSIVLLITYNVYIKKNIKNNS